MQKEAKNETNIISIRLENLSSKYTSKRTGVPADIKTLAENYKIQAQAYPENSQLWSEFMEKHKALIKIYEQEKSLNDALQLLWSPINGQLASLRDQIKQIVIFERKAGKALKRCANEQPDIDPNSILTYFIVENKRNNPNFDSYSGIVPPQLKLVGFQCGNFYNDDIEGEKTTKSLPIELIRFFEKTVHSYIEICAERERAYIEIETYAHTFKDKRGPRAALRNRLLKFGGNGRFYNDQIRSSLETILAQVIQLKKDIIEVEKRETDGAIAIDRCEGL